MGFSDIVQIIIIMFETEKIHSEDKNSYTNDDIWERAMISSIEMDRHTGDKKLIHGPHQRKGKLGTGNKTHCRISYLSVNP